MFMTIGTLISISDPVDIVHMLKAEGAKIKFTTMFELESSLNDATGIIFYMLFSSMSTIKDA